MRIRNFQNHDLIMIFIILIILLNNENYEVQIYLDINIPLEK